MIVIIMNNTDDHWSGSLDQFLQANCDDNTVCEKVSAMPVGGSIVLNHGTSPIWRIEKQEHCAECGEEREDDSHTCVRTRWNEEASDD